MKSLISIFIPFTPKQTRLKNLDEIKKRNAGFLSLIAIKTQLSDSNCPKALPKINFLSQVFNTKNNLSDSKSIALQSVVKSESKFEINENADFFSNSFKTKADKYCKQQKKNQYAS